MPLTRGTRLGPYEIVDMVGAGGMGEVYRAIDTRLNRTVAIKVSREAFTERFAREASVVAGLNHPNICTLHDVGPDYLVMEFVEGTPLRGPLPEREVLRVADDILAALDHAHRHGTVHRDLKPANILVTKQGIKLLDFGLAKVRAVTSADSVTVANTLTTEGTLLGTLQYMSPEQLEGREADERSDIYAFGCVLYELATGRLPFDGASPAALIAAVLSSTPEPLESPGLNRVVATCLARNPEDRWQSAHELRHALRWIAAERTANPPPRQAARSRLAWALAATAILTAVTFAILWLRQPTTVASRLAFTIDPPPGATFNYLVTATSVSHDGRTIVFRVSGDDLVPALWLRTIDSVTPRRLPGTEGADFPFWSPDNRSIAFFAGDRLKTLDLASGMPVVIASAVGGGDTWGTGGAWNRDGVMLFGETRGLIQLVASGGEPEVLIAADASRRDRGFAHPQFLPDGKHFLFLLISDDADAGGVYVASLDDPSSQVQILRTQAKAIYASTGQDQPGYLLFVRDQALVAQRFDATTLRIEGDPVVVTNDIATHSGLHAGAFWSSDSGTLIYRTGAALERTSLSWISRTGTHLGAAAPDDAYSTFRLAPDGKRLAFGRLEAGGPDDLWLMEFDSQRTTRFTFDPQIDTCPSWSRDGRQIAFSSDQSGVRQIYRKDTDGVGLTQQTSSTAGSKCVMDWSADGAQLLYGELGGSRDLWLLDVDGGRPAVPIVRTAFEETDGQFSPDGRWIAYTSDESGRNEVYVTTSRGGTEPRPRWPVSNLGGRLPRWRGDGKELYYLAADNRSVVSVDIRPSADGIQAGTPRRLFSSSTALAGGYTRVSYDVTPDGQRFLVQEPTRLQASPLNVFVNWLPVKP
jgi:Tol biopolymer transport system component/predicted Ser/Thr protein kinase